eukprot:c4497_g1_i1.p1 GENE.c4497_g1_i1~~c4497_g1_i1.p1  ORF type:complete len:1183 (+),score=200.41 c4497_g1_i1:63-3551(+)
MRHSNGGVVCCGALACCVFLAFYVQHGICFQYLLIQNSAAITFNTSALVAAAIPESVLAADQLCSSQFPRCVYCTQQTPCVWCEQTKKCRHPKALEMEDNLRMLWTYQTWNLTERSMEETPKFFACDTCDDGSCIDDGCARYSANELEAYGVQPNIEMIDITTLPTKLYKIYNASDWTGEGWVERDSIAPEYQWEIPEQIGKYWIVIRINNLTVNAACATLRSLPTECATPTYSIHDIHNVSLGGVVGAQVNDSRQPSMREWQTCYSYLTAKYATPDPYQPVSPDPVTNEWPIKKIRKDTSQIPCCTLCCCHAKMVNKTITVKAATYSRLAHYLTPSEMTAGNFRRDATNIVTSIVRPYVAICPMNSGQFSGNHSCALGVNQTTSYIDGAKEDQDEFGFVKGGSALCPDISCNGVLCAPDFECPFRECEASSLRCPSFDTCSGGANALQGNVYNQQPITISYENATDFYGTTSLVPITKTPSRTCSAAKNDSTYAYVTANDPCGAFDLLALSQGLTLYQLFQRGLYWDDNLVNRVTIASPALTPPAPTVQMTAVEKMLLEDGDSLDDWIIDDGVWEELGAKKKGGKAKSEAICPEHSWFDLNTGGCVCNQYWSGNNCDIPDADVFCDGLDSVTCTTVKELLVACSVESADEIDLDCAQKGMDAFTCLNSGLPFRKRLFEQFTTANNSIELRSTGDALGLASGIGGWVVSFAPGTGPVSSGPLNCNCSTMGIRCQCVGGAYGNFSSYPESEIDVIISSTNLALPSDVPFSEQGTWSAGRFEANYSSTMWNTDIDFEYVDVRVDGQGDTPIIPTTVSQRGWAEPLAMICNKCVGTPELMTKVCDANFLAHCHMLEGKTRHPLCNVCTPDQLSVSVITSNMQADITDTPISTTEKPLTFDEQEYQVNQSRIAATATRPITLKNDAQCHLLEEKVDVTTRENDMICHTPNSYCGGLMEAEQSNHPAKMKTDGFKNFGPLRCPHIRHCCVTEVSTNPNVTCSFEYTCTEKFMHPYTECGNRPTGCMPSLSMCEFNYTTYAGNPICGFLDSTLYNPWNEAGYVQNDLGCAAPSSALNDHSSDWYTNVGKNKMYSFDSTVDVSSTVCEASWQNWCNATVDGGQSDFVPDDGSFCTDYSLCTKYDSDANNKYTTALEICTTYHDEIKKKS